MDLAGKRILVTGGSGFLGRHLLAALAQAGCTQVVAPRRQECDLLDQSATRALLEKERPHVVIHLAARVGGIGANHRQPGTFAHDNLLMGTHLIEASRLAGVEKFVLAGTVCSYPKHTPAPFREADLWNGYPEETNAPYGLAKKMLMVLLQAYRREHGFRGVTLLLANLFGPGDNFDPETSHVIPALIRRCLEARARGDETLAVWGTGTPTREFLFVEDGARALVEAARTLDEAEPINIGSGREISIADLARLIAARTAFTGAIRFDSSKPDGQPRRCLDGSRARRLLGFEPQISLEEGLERTIAWWRAGSGGRGSCRA